MKERIKELRKALGLTQQEFANRIGISRGNIATYETRDGSPGNSVINLICREFNVSETWLRTGDGEMFIPSPEESIDDLIRTHSLDDVDRQILLGFIQLRPEERDAVKKFVYNLAQHINTAAPAPAPSPELTLEQEADQFAAMAREQFLSEKLRESQTSSAKESGAG